MDIGRAFLAGRGSDAARAVVGCSAGALRILGAVSAGVVLLLQACAHSPDGLAVGAQRAAVLQHMGTPTGEYSLPGGGARLEYAQGPYGRRTFMVDLDASGRLKEWSQVLDENHFFALHPGMDQSEVLTQIGRPGERQMIGWQERSMWTYRFETPFCIRFYVTIDREGKVASLGYSPDPLCEARPDSWSG